MFFDFHFFGLADESICASEVLVLSNSEFVDDDELAADGVLISSLISIDNPRWNYSNKRKSYFYE